MSEQVTFLRPTRPHGPEIVRQDDGLVLLTADAAVEEIHETSAEVTNHPIEEGGDVSDHVQPQPRTLRMSLLFSRTPRLERLQDINRIENTHRQFLDIIFDRQPVDIATTLEFYNDMVVEGYRVVRDNETGQMLSVDLELKQINRARSQTVEIPDTLLEDDVAATGQDEEQVPTQSSEDVSDSTEEESTTILGSIFGG